MGVKNTELHELWNDVLAEQADPSLARYRELEAELGFDADEGPSTIVATLSGLEGRAGTAAVEEIANAAGAARSRFPDRAVFLTSVEELAKAPGMAARFEPWLAGSADRAVKPSERGRNLAIQIRQKMALPRGPLADEVLETLLGGDFARPAGPAPIGLALRSDSNRATIHFRKGNPSGRRFEAARFIAEYALAPAQDSWLLTTDAGTARQKAQRAFAAEFLVPIADLKERLDGDFSSDEIEAVAEEYAVSVLTVLSHLANNGLISPEDVRVG